MTLEQLPGESDGDYVARRTRQSERDYLINATSPERAPRLAPALLALRAQLSDCDATPWTTAVAVALRSSDIAPKTIDNMLRKLIAHGFVVKRGEHTSAVRNRKRYVTDERTLHLGDWPVAT